MRRRSLTGLRKPKALRPWWFNGMLTEVRQRVIRLGQGGRGRKTDPAWAARPRLLRGYERLLPNSLCADVELADRHRRRRPKDPGRLRGRRGSGRCSRRGSSEQVGGCANGALSHIETSSELL